MFSDRCRSEANTASSGSQRSAPRTTTSAPPHLHTSARILLVLLVSLSGTISHAADISGTVFDDRNGDAMLRGGEPGLGEWVVFVDGDGDGVLDGDGACRAASREPCARSDGGGAFRLDGLPGGAHQVRVVLQPGWQPTTAVVQDILLLSDAASVAGVHFGVFRLATVSGATFADADGDGQRDAEERALPGWTIFADDNLDGLLDGDERRVDSDPSGTYALDGLGFGTRVVRARTRCGFRQTLPPPPGRYALSITSSGLAITGRDFAAQRPAVLPGDATGDGQLSAADLVAVARALGAAPTAGTDANEDGALTAADVAAAGVNLFDCGAYAALEVAATPTSTPTASPGAATATVPAGTATMTPPTATATATSLAAATTTATATVAGATPTGTNIVATETATRTATAVASATASATPTPSRSPTPSATSGATISATFSPSPTRTPTLTRTPTASAAPMLAVEPLAGAAVQIVNGVSAIPSVITALVSGVQFGSPLIFDPELGGPAGACPLGGSATRTCTGNTLDIGFTACRVATASGSVTIDELPPAVQAVHLQNPSGFCINNLVLPPWNATIDVQATFRDQESAVLLIATTDLTGTISPQLGGACGATAATLTVTGPIQTTFADGSGVRLTFDGTVIGVTVATFNAQCVPTNYTMTFNGPATVEELTAPGLARGVAPAASFDVVFDDFVVAQNAAAMLPTTTLSGGLDASCAGGPVTLSTLTPLLQAVGAPCPHGGTLRVAGGGATARVFYLAGGRVGIDANDDGASEQEIDSCQDAALRCQGGGGPTPTATRSATALPTPTHTPTRTTTPTATAPHSPTATATGSVVPATATATGTPTRTPTASRTATPTSPPSPSPSQTFAPALFCDTLPGPAVIPDDDPTGITNSIVIGSNAAIADLDVRLSIAHTWVGDLRVALTHVESGRSAVLLDRPGLVEENGCPLDDVGATFDDAALRVGNDRCAEGPPLVAAIDGSVQPHTPLATFAGDTLAGTWQLSVSDRAVQDSGSLLGWCLLPNSLAPGVTAATCEAGLETCGVVIDEPFTVTFSYVDADANAVSWQVRRVRDDGVEDIAGAGDLTAPGSGTVPLLFEPFTCPTNDCRDTIFDYFITVRDAAGQDSPAQRVRLIVTLFGG